LINFRDSLLGSICVSGWPSVPPASTGLESTGLESTSTFSAYWVSAPGSPAQFEPISLFGRKWVRS